MVPPDSHRVPPAPWYSGTCDTAFCTVPIQGFHLLRLRFPADSGPMHQCGEAFEAASSHAPQPRTCNGLDLGTCTVWALPLSLATTQGISFDFSSSGYLDGSVPRVRLPCGMTALAAGLPHSEIPGSTLAAAPLGLSQLATSFIASWRLGIHRAPLVAYPKPLAYPKPYSNQLLNSPNLHCQRSPPAPLNTERQVVENTGLEPVTSAVQGRRSPN